MGGLRHRPGGDLPGCHPSTDLRFALPWVDERATAAVDTCLPGGRRRGRPARLVTPLQRRFRDIHTFSQHFGVKLDTFTLAGAVLAGQEVDTSFL